jgi:hypothetical protein
MAGKWWPRINCPRPDHSSGMAGWRHATGVGVGEFTLPWARRYDLGLVARVANAAS